MGRIEKIICKECRSDWKLNVGAGRMHCNIRYVLPYFGLEEQQRIKKGVESAQFAPFNFFFKEGYCNNCNNIISVPVIDLGDGKTEYGKCPDCEQKLDESSVVSLRCPKCNNNLWVKENIGHWD